MFKKVIYVASVSLLTLSLLANPGKAVYERELDEVITKSLSRPAVDSSEEASSSTESSYWDYVCSVAVGTTRVTGSILRATGDVIRGDTVTGDIFVNRALTAAASYGGAGDLVQQVEKEGALAAWRLAVGNAVRWTGALLKEPNPALGRDLVEFWVAQRKGTKPEIALPSTAYSLIHRMQDLQGVDGVVTEYKSFVGEFWNRSSHTNHVPNSGTILEYFLQGILRFSVRSGEDLSSFDSLKDKMTAFNIDLAVLPVTSKITPETLVPNESERKAMSPNTLEDKISAARKEAFMTYVKGQVEFEKTKMRTEESHSRSRASSSQATDKSQSQSPASSEVSEQGSEGNDE